jgi:hypothetical protein
LWLCDIPLGGYITRLDLEGLGSHCSAAALDLVEALIFGREAAFDPEEWLISSFTNPGHVEGITGQAGEHSFG